MLAVLHRFAFGVGVLETRRVDDGVGAELAARLEGLLPLVADHATAANEARRPSREVMSAFGEAGLLRLLVPTDYGGHGASPRTFLELTERLARVDGSTAWTVMTCNEEAGIASAYLHPQPMTDLFRTCPATVIAGSGVPRGRAEQVEGGWRITGRWDFVSGCTAADQIVLASTVPDSNPRRLCFALVPSDEAAIEDTWHTHGLRGSGSHDVVLDDHLVPEHRVGIVELFALPRPESPFYRLPSPLRFPFPKVGVAAGIARAAIEEFQSLATGKQPLFSRGNLAERASAQAAVAHAEAQVAAGLAWAREVVDELWTVAIARSSDVETPIEPELHARCRLACSYAVTSSITAVERLSQEAGSTGNLRASPLPQLLLDVRAVAGHFMVGPYQMNTAGRVLLGLDAKDPQF